MAPNTPSKIESKTPPTVIGLLRHGKTQWNAQKKIQGSCNSPLTEEGRNVVADWGGTLFPMNWQRILSSNLGRAKETAEILNNYLKLPLHLDTRLREQDWGEWEEQTIEEIRQHSPGSLEKQISAGWNFQAPGGESRMEVYVRSHEALVNAANTWPGEKILMITHQGVIQCLLYHLKARQFLPTEKKILKKNCLHTLQYENKRFKILGLNDSLEVKA